MTLATTKNVGKGILDLQARGKTAFEKEAMMLMGQVHGLVDALQIQVRLLSEAESELERRIATSMRS